MIYKLPKGNFLYTRCCQKENGEITHIICKKEFAERDKMWILYSIREDNSLDKIAQGSNPQKLEEKIKYERNT